MHILCMCLVYTVGIIIVQCLEYNVCPYLDVNYITSHAHCHWWLIVKF